MRRWGRLFTLLLTGVILAFSGVVTAEPQRPLRIGSEIDFPPYADIDAQGRSTGFAVELFTAVAKVMDIPVTFHPDRWEVVWEGLKTGKIDALPLVAHIPEREGQVEFTQPHTFGYDSFFVRKGSPAPSSLEQARTLNIIVLRGDAAHETLASRGFARQLVIVDDLADGFRLLASGQHDALLAPLLQGRTLVGHIGLDNIVTAGPLINEYRREFCFATSKDNTELRDRLDQGLAIVKASGEYDRLYKKWLDIDETSTFPFKYVTWAAVITASLVAFLVLWTWQLRRQVALRTAELAQAYTAVQAERQRMHDVLQSLPVYVVLLTQDYQVTFANRFFEQRYGKAHGRRCYQYLFDRNSPCEVCETFRVFQTGKPLNWKWTGPDDRDYEIHDFPFTSSDGSPMIMEVGIDVTEMNRAKLALSEANASLERRVSERTAELELARQEAEQAQHLLQVTMDNAPALMSYIDKECMYRRINRNYERWFGMSDEQVRGRHMRDILGEATWNSVAPYVQRVLGGEQVNFELQVPYPDLNLRWVHATYSPDFDAEGQVRGFVVHVLDISERKRAQNALKDIDHRKDEFLAMLAHELRNPLAPISNTLHIMAQPGLDEARLSWCREVIGRQVEHMVRLVDDLLDVSRINQGKIELKKEPLDLSSIVQRAIETSHPLIETHRHEISVRLPPEPVFVEGDLVRLSQVVSNLLNNAAKYTDEGGSIRLVVEPTDNEIFIRVCDNGRGIDPSALSGLFQLFYQVDRTIDRAEGGLGIGLALVKRLVMLHGGDVWAESEGRGKGSQFVVRLPRLIPIATETVTSSALAAPNRGGLLRILVVDDNRDAAESLAMLLQVDGHHVKIAHDGQAAQEMARAEQPDVILLDIGLPEMDGYSVAKSLRQFNGLQHTLLIALTGYGKSEDREKSLTAGFDEHLVKPADIETLRKLLASKLAETGNAVIDRQSIDLGIGKIRLQGASA